MTVYLKFTSRTAGLCLHQHTAAGQLAVDIKTESGTEDTVPDADSFDDSAGKH